MANPKPIPIMLAASVPTVAGRAADDPKAGDTFDVEELYRVAKKRAKDPSVFETRAPFFWRSEVSSDVMDTYFTRMHVSTLKAFARDSSKGISFQHSHTWNQLGLGWSLVGEYEAISDEVDVKGKKASGRTTVDFFTMPGLRLNSEIATDDFIDGVRGGLLNDVSVGFYAGKIECGICGGDMYNGFFGIWGKDCNHYPGMEYTDPYVDEKGNHYGGKVVAFAWVHDGRLSEVSQVYDGATPGAGHLKAQLYAESGKADARSLRMLEAHYRTKLPGGAFVLPVGAGLVGVDGRRLDGGGAGMEGQENEGAGTVTTRTEGSDGSAAVVTTQAATRSDAAPAKVSIGAVPNGRTAAVPGVDGDGEDVAAVLLELRGKWKAENIELTGDVRTTVDGLCEAVVGLRARAALGDTYMADLIEDALAEGVRAHGDTFDKERQRRKLQKLDIEDVKAERDLWANAAKQSGRFPEAPQGGSNRRSVDVGEDPPAKPAETDGEEDRFYQA